MYRIGNRPRQAIALCLLAFSVSLGLAGCGGGGGGSGGGPPAIVVSFSQGDGDMPLGGSRVFSVSVQNDPSNGGVTWSLKGSACNGAPCGTLSDVSANSVIYNAPNQMPSSATETLTATAVVDSSASATIAITIISTIQVSVSPVGATIALGDTRRFSAEVSNDLGGLGATWNISGCPAQVACGSFSATNTSVGQPTYYRAPTSIPHDIQATVTATSIADPSRSATATLTISTTAQPISVSVSPAAMSLPIGDMTLLTANGTQGTGVSWSIAGCTSGPCGGLSSAQLISVTYLAPQSPATAQPGNQVTITATSVENISQSASVTVTLTPAPMGFSMQDFPAGNAPIAVAITDFNGDGKMDVAVADHGNPAMGDNGDISILLGNGDGSFQAASHFQAGKNPISIAAGDLNLDGTPDLIVSGFGDRPTGGQGDLNILLGNGDGSLQVANPSAAGNLPFTLAAADFNSDSKLDLAVSDFGNGDNGGVNLLAGNGDGTLQLPILQPAGVNPVGIAATDFNRDGKLDLAVADNRDPSAIGRGGVSILLGSGSGSFQLVPTLFRISSVPTSIAAGDLNGDGMPDVVVSSFISVFGRSVGTMNVLLGDGSGMFESKFFGTGGTSRGSPAAFLPLSANVGDFDGDGNQDVAEIVGSSVVVLEGKGDGTFRGRLNFAAGTSPFVLTVGDVNGDGRPDLAVANRGGNDVSILLNVSGP
jgi:hypothetical protein